MLGREFVAEYAKKGLVAWEAAALSIARQDGLVPWAWKDLTLASGTDSVTLKVQSDVLAIGTFEDHVRLPLTPGTAQSILNLGIFGGPALLPTPWLEYQIWRATSLGRLQPTPMVPNKGPDLDQYFAHSRIIDAQIAASGLAPGSLVSGIKKGVVVANFYKPGKVLLFGWYRAMFIPVPGDWGSPAANASAKLDGPATDIFDDGHPMVAPNGYQWPNRQPIQPKSWIHDQFYLDYSHGIRVIAPTALVTTAGQTVVMPTQELYQHPTLSRLVSNEGPIKVPRYPAAVPPVPLRPVLLAEYPAAVDVIEGGSDAYPSSMSEHGLAEIARIKREREGG